MVDARAGESQVLVLRGEAGVGKSALLDYLTARPEEWHVARAAGIESEVELAFAGLHQLCSPYLDRLERLPAPQQIALATAFGMSPGEPPDRFMVGLATLGLFAEVAEESPLICIVDDAHWLDRVSAQTLVFVARRLLAERVALVIAVREPNEGNEFGGLNDLVVQGLSEADSVALLDSAIGGPVDGRIRDRIVAETRGNPLALLELPRGLTAAELAFGSGVPDAMPLTSRIEDGFGRRLEPLPADTRRLLLAAAVEPVGDPTLLWRAAERLGIGPSAAAPAEAAGLIELGVRVRFRHPLVRSAAYRAASLQERREVHGALAEVTDPALDPDRRAWHRAQAAPAPDEQVAGELGALGRPRADAWRFRRGGRAPRGGGSAHAGRLAPRTARVCRRAGKAPGRRARRRAGPVGHGGSRAVRRAATSAARPPQSEDRVRLQARQRRTAAPAQGRRATQAA